MVRLSTRLPSLPGAALLWAALAVSSCAAQTEAELLTVGDVGPSRIEPGRTLRLTGSGFPPGRGCRVRLEGTMLRPGRPPREVRMELTGQAVSPELVEASFTEDALRRLGGRGTLRGDASVLFNTADRTGAVVGRSPPLVLDVVPASTRQLGDALAHQRRAGALLTRIGLEVGEEPPEEAGLPLETVEEASVAERAGLVPGDRIVEANGVVVHALGDLLPPRGAERLELRVGRQGESAPFRVELPVGGERRGMAIETVRAAQAALGWMLLVLLWLAPTAQVADWLGRRVRRAPARPTADGEAPRVGLIRRWWRRHGRGLRQPALAVTAFASLPVADRAGLLTVPLEAVVLGALALRVSSAWLAGAGRPRWRRALDLGHAGAGVVAIGVALAAVAALGGTTDLGGLHEQQGAAPWTWTLLRTPLGPLALGLVLVGGGTAPAPVARGTGAQAGVARALDDLVLVAVAAVTTAVLLGGWGPSGLGAGGRAGFAVLYVVLSTLLWSWMRRGRRLGRPTRAGVTASLVLVVAVAVGTALRITWEPPPELERGLARAIGAAAALLGVTTVARLLAGHVRGTPEPAHPFL